MDLLTSIFSVFTVSALLSWILLTKIQRVCFKKKLFDSNDERKPHKGIVPRLGGVAFLPVLAFAFLLTLGINLLQETPLALSINMPQCAEIILALLGVALLYFTGVGDDLVNVSFRTKLIVQLMAGILFVSSGMWIDNLHGFFGLYEISPVIGFPVTVFIIVFIINSINFIDGIDGLAAAIGMFAFFCYGFIFLYKQSYVYCLLAFGALGMLIPFFYYNVFGKSDNENKIFMGDSGSLTLGMLLSVFAVKVCNFEPVGVTYSEQSFILAFSVLIVPVFDALRVILTRIASGKTPFRPDNNHLHHHFLRLGFSHRATLLLIMAIVVFFGAGSILLSSYVIIEWLLVSAVLLWIIMDIFLRIKVKQSAQHTVIPSEGTNR